MPLDDYVVYAPPFLIEVLSPSNGPAKVNRQRLVAMSPGTQEFWVVDAEERTVLVTGLAATTTYAAGKTIPANALYGSVSVDEIFAI